ncbi:MAG TPA: hypothetical protein VLX68_16620 [Chitinivibrionales bacterium]|nr:hypothetical protein [Chitinivibrionales bacterium]
MKDVAKKLLAILASASIAVCIVAFGHSRLHSHISSTMMPWSAVGGCGSSAGSATGDVIVKWIGNGVSGTLFDAELIMSEGTLSDSSLISGSAYDGRLRLKTTTALLSVFYHPPRIMDIKLSMPFLLKEGNSTNTGGFGDLLLDVSRKLGTSGNIQTGLSLVIPTGYATIMNTSKDPLASENQLGGGLFGACLRGSYTFDLDRGIINLGATYSAGLFALKTTEYNYDTAVDYNNREIRDLTLSPKTQNLEFTRESWGARNDAGVYSPDFLGIFADFGIRTEGYTHGFCVTYSYPMAQGNVQIWDVLTTYTSLPTRADAQRYLDTCRTGDVPHGDTSHVLLSQRGDGTWDYLIKAPTPRSTPPTLTLQYSLEKTDMLFPILVGGIVKLEYLNRLNFAGISLGVGFKFPVY